MSKDKEFSRNDSHKKKSIPNSWRKPKGTHNKARLNKKEAPNTPNPGYRTRKAVRGKHPSGYEEVIVNNVSELEEIDSDGEAARIASKVGGKKREKIIEKADEEDIHVLNRGEENDE
jgi:large subunit ribosomal protein L32e